LAANETNSDDEDDSETPGSDEEPAESDDEANEKTDEETGAEQPLLTLPRAAPEDTTAPPTERALRALRRSAHKDGVVEAIDPANLSESNIETPDADKGAHGATIIADEGAEEIEVTFGREAPLFDETHEDEFTGAFDTSSMLYERDPHF